MAIRNVGGLPIYIIDAPAVESAKTSTGTGYASLVSQLRWQIWEASRQAVKDQMEFEKLGYEAKLDAFVREKQELTRALAKAQDLKEKLKSGNVSAAAAVAAANLEYRIAKDRQARADKLGLERVSEREFVNPLTGEKETLISYSGYEPREGAASAALPSAATLIARGAAAVGYKSPEDKKAEAEAIANSAVSSSTKEWSAAWRASGIKDPAEFAQSEAGKSVEAKLTAAKDALAKITSTPVSEFSKTEEDVKAEQDLADYETELQRRLNLLNVPAPTFDTNVLSRTRETFGGMAGVGPFGFAPRKDKISPIYDEARAKEALDRAKAVESEAVSLSTAEKYNAKKAALLSAKEKAKQNRIAELEVLAGTEDPANKEFQKLISAEIEKLKVTPASLNSEEDFSLLSSSESESLKELSSGLIDVGPGSRTAASFMTRQTPEIVTPDDSPRTKISPDPFKNFVLPGVDSSGFTFGGQGPGQVKSPTVVSERFESAKGSVAGPPGTTSKKPSLEEAVYGVKKSYPKSSEDEISFGGGILPPTPEEGPIELDESNRDIKIENLSPTVERILASPEELNRKKGSAAKEVFITYGINTDANDDEKLKVYEEFIIEEKYKDPRFNLNSEGKLIDPAATEWYKKTLDTIRATEGKTGKVQPKTRSQRSAAYAVNIIKKGKELADKPAKLARLAKTDLPEAERMKKVPEHIALVDKLYEINKSKGDVYKSTYSEIARVYEKQPKLRDAALEYLVAKNLLYGNIA